MDLLEAAEIAGLSPRKMANYRGGEYRCGCPACGGGEKSDRFLLWPEYKGGRFRCRHCPVHGDTVQLLVDYAGYSYRDAFKAVGRDNPMEYQPRRRKPKTKAWVRAITIFDGHVFMLFGGTEEKKQ